MLRSIGYRLSASAFTAIHGRRFSALLEAAKSPAEVQSSVLRRILAANAETSFGRRHNFSRIGNAADYRRAVAVHTYEDLRDDIEAQELTGETRLTSEPPVFYNRTSGTVGAPKNIPVTQPGLRSIRANQQLAAYALSQGSSVMSGKVYAVAGAAVEGCMPGGTAFGSASGLLYQNQPRWLKSRYVVPTELYDIVDYEERYLAMAMFGIAEPGVTCLATPNSSTLLRILEVLNDHSETILGAVAEGRPPKGFASLAPLKRDPRRANHLRARLDTSGRLTYADLWPHLAGVVTWTGGSCGVAIRDLRHFLPVDCDIIELGYIASEVQGTINIAPRGNECLPTLQETFFEFMEREDRESGGAEMLGLGELEQGRDYYVVVTTSNGLYRYDMNDIVRVTGLVNDTPTLSFVQKGVGVTSITGEKLYEAQVLEAVSSVLVNRQIETSFFILLADQETARYTLYVETNAVELGPEFARDVDACLRLVNVEFDSKRASGRLKPVNVRFLSSRTGDAYRKHRVAQGQRDAQFKYLPLQYAHECSFDFEAHVVKD